jgi:hypothetical protein
MELHYAVLKNNRVMNIIVVEEQNDTEIQSFCNAMEYDEFIYLGNSPAMPLYSLRVDGEFIPADYDYLKSIGLSTRDNAEQAAWEAEFIND